MLSETVKGGKVFKIILGNCVYPNREVPRKGRGPSFGWTRCSFVKSHPKLVSLRRSIKESFRNQRRRHSLSNSLRTRKGSGKMKDRRLELRSKNKNSTRAVGVGEKTKVNKIGVKYGRRRIPQEQTDVYFAVTH